MRTRIVAATALMLAAVPAFAQSPADVTGRLTLSPWMIACTDLPVTAPPQPKLFVKGAHATDGRAMLSKGGVVAIDRTADDGLAPGQRYVVRRLTTGADSYSLKDRMGFRGVRTAGFVTVTAVDEHNALATIDFACDGVLPGDYLETYVEPTLPSAASPMAEPDFSDRAAILAGTEKRSIFGDGESFSIDRGTAHSVTVGARYAIYRDWRDGARPHEQPLGVRPLVYVADAVVMEIFELTSKVVIVKSVDVVTIEDVAVPRRQP